MSVVVVLLFLVVWVLLLLPGAIRGRRDARPAASAASFERQMHRLGASVQAVHEPQSDAGIGASRPRQRSRLCSRRRRVIIGLAAVTLAAVAAAVVGGGWLWAIAGAAGALLAGYVVGLRRVVAEARRRGAVTASPSSGGLADGAASRSDGLAAEELVGAEAELPAASGDA
jgi:hypothetical protein